MNKQLGSLHRTFHFGLENFMRTNKRYNLCYEELKKKSSFFNSFVKINADQLSLTGCFSNMCKEALKLS